ncbi:hypothetical protein HDU76_007574 [Blyttiomyces sp. JEL0837]|nr:hypothetical protein HDU76_007574 [Blyttiomyces sp. JEL0837]
MSSSGSGSSGSSNRRYQNQRQESGNNGQERRQQRPRPTSLSSSSRRDGTTQTQSSGSSSTQQRQRPSRATTGNAGNVEDFTIGPILFGDFLQLLSGGRSAAPNPNATPSSGNESSSTSQPPSSSSFRQTRTSGMPEVGISVAIGSFPLAGPSPFSTLASASSAPSASSPLDGLFERFQQQLRQRQHSSAGPVFTRPTPPTGGSSTTRTGPPQPGNRQSSSSNAENVSRRSRQQPPNSSGNSNGGNTEGVRAASSSSSSSSSSSTGATRPPGSTGDRQQQQQQPPGSRGPAFEEFLRSLLIPPTLAGQSRNGGGAPATTTNTPASGPTGGGQTGQERVPFDEFLRSFLMGGVPSTTTTTNTPTSGPSGGGQTGQERAGPGIPMPMPFAPGLGLFGSQFTFDLSDGDDDGDDHDDGAEEHEDGTDEEGGHFHPDFQYMHQFGGPQSGNSSSGGATQQDGRGPSGVRIGGIFGAGNVNDIFSLLGAPRSDQTGQSSTSSDGNSGAASGSQQAPPNSVRIGGIFGTGNPNDIFSLLGAPRSDQTGQSSTPSAGNSGTSRGSQQVPPLPFGMRMEGIFGTRDGNGMNIFSLDSLFGGGPGAVPTRSNQPGQTPTSTTTWGGLASAGTGPPTTATGTGGGRANPELDRLRALFRAFAQERQANAADGNNERGTSNADGGNGNRSGPMPRGFMPSATILTMVMTSFLSAIGPGGFPQHMQGQPPASEKAISELRKIALPFSLKRKEKRGAHITCVVCQENFDGVVVEKADVGEGGEGSDLEECVMMPCRHLFHSGCLKPWLKTSNTCPTCRFEIMTDNDDYNRGVTQRMADRMKNIVENDTDDEEDVLVAKPKGKRRLEPDEKAEQDGVEVEAGSGGNLQARKRAKRDR